MKVKTKSDRVATGQEIVREKNSSRSGKSQGIFFESGKIDILKKSQRKLKEFNTADLTALKAKRNIWGHCELSGIFL